MTSTMMWLLPPVVETEEDEPHEPTGAETPTAPEPAQPSPTDEALAAKLEKDKVEAERWVEMAECFEKLTTIKWVQDAPDTSQVRHALDWIFANGMRYCTIFENGTIQGWNFPDFPLSSRAWTSEFERVLNIMHQRGMSPRWLVEPHDRFIREDAGASADGFVDPGNFHLDTFVHIFRLWRFASEPFQASVMRQPIAEYGSRANKSAKGPVNLRGNIVEAISKVYQKFGSGKAAEDRHYDAFDWWVTQQNDRPPRRDSGRGHSWSGAAASSGWQGGWHAW